VTGEPTAPGIGPVTGWLDGRPLPRTELNRRLAALRGGPRSSTLPVPGSAEDRQLIRWVAQVILTEELCAAEAAARGLDLTDAPPVRLDQRTAVELGSITAAAFEGSAAVRAVYQAITVDVTVSPGVIAAYRTTAARSPAGPVWRLSTPDGEFDGHPDTLPADLASALHAAVPGQTVTAGPWTATLLERYDAETDQAPASADPANHTLTSAGLADRTPTSIDPTVHTLASADPAAHTLASADPADHLLAAARHVTFVRWLDRARAHRLRLVPGLEHPGDPAQPDNHHRH
jgi:[acyl-carrier-protein] S-malonyltransferase